MKWWNECILRWVPGSQLLVCTFHIPTPSTVESLRNLGAEQGHRYDHKVAVAHKAFFGCCIDRFACWESPSQHKTIRFGEGVTMYSEEEEAKDIPWEKEIKVGAYMSRWWHSVAWWGVSGSCFQRETVAWGLHGSGVNVVYS